MLEKLSQTSRSAMALPFRPVDVQAQAKAYRLEARGKQDGAEQLPPTDSDAPADAELEVIGAILADRDRCLVDLTSHLRAERDALAQLQTAMDIAAMRQGADSAVSMFRELEARYGASLSELGREAQSATQEYDDFRKRNRLVRTARQPSNRSLSLALVAFMIVFEAILNAWFFASGSDSGLLGGVFLAAAFSAVNVAIGVLTGLFPCRWFNHRNLFIKLVGLLLSLGLIAASVVLNLFVAHFRDVSQSFPDQPPLGLAYTGLLRDPLGLQTIESWFLLALGTLFAMYAITKGYGLDDPYPKYGTVDRRRIAALRSSEAMRQSALDDASDVRDNLIEHFSSKIESLRGSSAQRQQILASRTRNIAGFWAHEKNLEAAGRQLLEIYRRSNRIARSTPPPVRFNKEYLLPDHALDRPALRALLEDQGLEVDAESLVQELDVLRRDVLADYRGIVKHYPENPVAA